MPREFNRTARLGEQIQRELANLLLTEVNDPRLAGVVVSAVEVSRDLSHARVYLTLPLRAEGAGDEAPLAALAKASGYLRRQLASRLHIRAVPQLQFEEDRTLDEADRIERLLGSVKPSSDNSG